MTNYPRYDSSTDPTVCAQIIVTSQNPISILYDLRVLDARECERAVNSSISISLARISNSCQK